MGEIRFVGTCETRGYPYLVCKKSKLLKETTLPFLFASLVNKVTYLNKTTINDYSTPAFITLCSFFL